MQHFVNQLEYSKQMAELQYHSYQQNLNPDAQSHGRLVHNSFTPIDHSTLSAESAAQNPSPTHQHLDQSHVNRHSPLNPQSEKGNPYSPALDTTLLYAAGAPVSTTNSSYSDILEPLYDPRHVESFEVSNNDLLDLYSQRQHQTDEHNPFS
jgi:hypothetical protein